MTGPRVFAPSGEGDANPGNAAAAQKSHWTDLLPRVASAVFMVVLALSALVVGGRLFAAFWFVASLAIHWEWQRMVGGERQLLRFFIGAAVLAVATSFTLSATLDMAASALLIGALALAWAAGPGARLWAAAGIFYAAALVMSVCLLRASVFDGFEAVLWLFAVVWGTDVMAYFGGRAIGGRKLAPRISPAKTWSGLLSGVICGTLIGVCILVPLAKAAVVPVVILGLVVALVSQAGDLFESAVKRHFGVKDTSRLIPGHGGFMDRLDGFIAGSAFAALFGLARAGTAAAAAHGLFYW